MKNYFCLCFKYIYHEGIHFLQPCSGPFLLKRWGSLMLRKKRNLKISEVSDVIKFFLTEKILPLILWGGLTAIGDLFFKKSYITFFIWLSNYHKHWSPSSFISRSKRTWKIWLCALLCFSWHQSWSTHFVGSPTELVQNLSDLDTVSGTKYRVLIIPQLSLHWPWKTCSCSV